MKDKSIHQKKRYICSEGIVSLPHHSGYCQARRKYENPQHNKQEGGHDNDCYRLYDLMRKIKPVHKQQQQNQIQQIACNLRQQVSNPGNANTSIMSKGKTSISKKTY
nr:hypothetical protein [Orrella marina]